MARTIPTPAVASLEARSIIIDATRCWRRARDSRSPVQPALYAALATHRCAVLTPVLDGLLALYEACIGRRLRAGASGQAEISGDERDLLDLLAGAEEDLPLPGIVNPGLTGTLRIALRSARFMLRLALEPCEQRPVLRVLAPA